MLHTINKSPFSSDSFDTCIRFLQPGDPVLFIEDGVYAVQSGNRFSSAVGGMLHSNPVYALKPDLDARGVSGLTDGVETIDYDGFVDLVEAHQVNSWL
ncbi:MAG: sulfurtransferase complex subunit TusB [Chlorobium sp.]|jgi:tRNA 2-thiouridine synthesizing protein B|uniref:sulfurtransferase complex subunit TusB n=1 Tax=Chlorobium sp. TaxID=1095 RepID=UPI001DFFE14B|nr:sulfurtransferase complex subunit TusB [Chlorobium sp.]MBN1279969.1 sulfurtransferase complex subunit TusB [Chlorobiaceae bacterium]MCF8215669.1 sulfurtransferase complex subunit TusB [Chlorobium sp.]MCF8271912.1 sulfurtransferase complex subunit TusB [Chlorobium sp.]MCF8286878.1 sulfurtransferase complex subunit TusB [Chlorobium sp.]MCF8291859.1 sulfurtransferase complex subunit TusB [Chlorobium sp.]